MVASAPSNLLRHYTSLEPLFRPSATVGGACATVDHEHLPRDAFHRVSFPLCLHQSRQQARTACVYSGLRLLDIGVVISVARAS